MKSLIPSIWNRVQDWQGDKRIKECIEAIQDNADQSDPTLSRDPIAFIYVFATVLIWLVPFDVIRRRKDEIYEVMDDLVEIFVEEDGSPWPYSRKECTDRAFSYFLTAMVELSHHNLVNKLTSLRSQRSHTFKIPGGHSSSSLLLCLPIPNSAE